jgi:methylmalonyl-CoA mutase
MRSTDSEKQAQIEGLQRFQAANTEAAPQALASLQQAALQGGNVFASLMEAAKVCSLGQMSQALYRVGGQYRRNM